jgi:hypothetical protein
MTGLLNCDATKLEGELMKLPLAFLAISISLFSEISFARNTPFDSFAGKYKVGSHKCFNLIENTELVVDAYSELSIVPSQSNKEVRILMKNDKSNINGILDEYGQSHLSGRFFGDGVSSAGWAQQIDQKDFFYRYEKSISQIGNRLIFIMDEKSVEQRTGLPPRNDHTRCELELI